MSLIATSDFIKSRNSFKFAVELLVRNNDDDDPIKCRGEFQSLCHGVIISPKSEAKILLISFYLLLNFS